MKEHFIEMHDAIINMKLRSEMNDIELKRFTERLDKILSKKPQDGETESKQLPKQKKVRNRTS